jgi:uncharacterized ParB-like nuclease family protein
MIPRALRPGRSLPAALVTALALSGCGSSATVVDHTLVEKAIEISIAQQQHVLSIVSCPKGLTAKKGLRFVCGATLASGKQLPISVLASDAKGNVTYTGFNGFVNGQPVAPHK